MWGGAVPQTCCFNLLFSFGWREDWQSRNICSRNRKRFLAFTNFHPGGKAAAELNEKRLRGVGVCVCVCCCLPWLASNWYGGCRIKSSEHQDAHWLFPTFFHQHLWNAIPSKAHLKMKTLAGSLYRTSLWGYEILLQTIYDSLVIFLKVCQYYLQIVIYTDFVLSESTSNNEDSCKCEVFGNSFLKNS